MREPTAPHSSAFAETWAQFCALESTLGPTHDAIADTQRFHQLIEAHVRRYPEQYLWAYKRFRRPGFDPYRLES